MIQHCNVIAIFLQIVKLLQFTSKLSSIFVIFIMYSILSPFLCHKVYTVFEYSINFNIRTNQKQNISIQPYILEACFELHQTNPPFVIYLYCLTEVQLQKNRQITVLVTCITFYS